MLFLDEGLAVIVVLFLGSSLLGGANCESPMGEEIARGQKLSLQMRRSPQLFTPLSAQMVGVGEETGDLPKILERLAKFYQREVDASVDTLVSLIEPIMIVSRLLKS